MQWPHASGGSLSAHAWSILQRIVDQATRVFAADRRIIQSRWQAEAYPRENSLAFANGFYCLFETSEPHPQVMEKAWVPASDAWQADAEGCEGLAVLNTVALSDTRITCGECCAAGEDGFIAVSEAANQYVGLAAGAAPNGPIRQRGAGGRWRSRHLVARHNGSHPVGPPGSAIHHVGLKTLAASAPVRLAVIA